MTVKLILTILTNGAMLKDLTKILTDVASIIGANILNIASQDYEPQGASVTMLISEEKILDTPVEEAQAESPVHCRKRCLHTLTKVILLCTFIQKVTLMTVSALSG